ncbi:MAG TPA: sensor histidine kinase, partial [Pedomonas sp.]|nr:sensor histidine kinase [Pedomonas sp.]
MAYGGAVTRNMNQNEAAPAGPLVLGLPGVRVRTLLTIRWIAIVGQFMALVIVGLVLKYPLPIWPTLAAVAASVAVNLGSTLLHPAKAYLTGREATVHLAFDLLQLSVLLYLTGGLTNPFAVLILVPVTISSTLLSLRNTVFLFLLATACLTALSFSHLPLPWPGEPLTLPVAYRVGQWMALAFGMAFLTAYAWQVSAEGRRRQQALVATQTALAREQKMSELGSLAAAAAHELGGPLGTITLIARELDDQLGNDPDFGSDIRLLRDEAARCREILVGIARRAEAEQPFPVLPLDTLMNEVFQPFEGREIDLSVTYAS